jgi:hypothetical protein
MGERAHENNTPQGESAVGSTVAAEDVLESALKFKKTPILNTDYGDTFPLFCRHYWRKVLVANYNSHRLTTTH